MNTSVRWRKQQGFIQGAILVGLALLVLVVAGFSLANRDAAATTGKEQARLNASVMMKQAGDVKDALYRAIADNASPADVPALRTLGYITELPVPPADTTAGVTPYFSTGYFSANLTSVGTAANDTYILVWSVSDQVCQRINAALYSTLAVPVPAAANVSTTTGALTLTTSPWPGRSEGCVPNSSGTANANVYYKVAVIR